MVQVQFTSALKRFYPEISSVNTDGKTVEDVIKSLNKIYPGITDYIVDEKGALRKNVNIFIGNKMINDRQKLQDVVSENDQLYIMQALSGG